MNCRKFSLGYFKNCSAVAIRKIFEYEREVFFNPRKSVDIKLFGCNVTRIEITFAAMSKFSFFLINNNGITVYINLSHVPYFSKLGPFEGKRSPVYQGEIQGSFAKCPLLLVTVNTQDYLKLHKIFHSSTKFSVSLRHTKLELCDGIYHFHS